MASSSNRRDVHVEREAGVMGWPRSCRNIEATASKEPPTIL